MRSHQLLGGLLVWMTLSTVTTFAAAINVNGTCEVGTCTPPDLLAMGDSVSAPFSFVYTFANTDQYRGTGTVAASNTSDTNGLVQITAASIILTYLGNSSGTLSSADTLVIDFLQNFQTPFPTQTNTTGFEFISGDFSGSYSLASSVSGQGFTNGGTAMLLMGPFFPPNPFSASNTNQPVSVGPTTLLDYRDTVTFGAGSNVGATISVANVPPVSTIPEPATWVFSGTGALILLLTNRRRVLG